jgi:hypothetical protein
MIKTEVTMNFDSLKEYITHLHEIQMINLKKKIELKYLSRDLADLFYFNKEVSIKDYEALIDDYKQLGRSKSPKPFHTRFHKLIDSNIISSKFKKKFKKEDTNKKFYILTPFGIYYIIFTSEKDHYDNFQIVKNYPNDELFVNLLYPYIPLDTLLKIKSPWTKTQIINLLRTICNDIDTMLDILKEGNELGRFIGPYNTFNLTASDFDDEESELRKFIQNIKDHYGVEWEDPSQVKITSIKNSHSLKVSDGKKVLILQIDLKTQRATILENEKAFGIFKVEEDRERELNERYFHLFEYITASTEEILDQELPWLIKTMPYTISRFCLDMVNHYPTSTEISQYPEEIIDDLLRIFSSPTIRITLSELKKDTDERSFKLEKLLNDLSKRI